MYKILVVNIDIRLKDEKKNFIEFEPTELNKLLNDGENRFGINFILNEFK
jgi:hypothetical protein